MNTYNENLRIAVSTALTGIDTTQQQRQSALTVAHYNLYYAVGEQIVAQEKLDRANYSYQQTDAINHQGVSCSNRANNLFDSATMADTNVDALVTTTATAAQNVQVAANAVVKLAADVGGANNIVNASEYDTDIMHMTVDVNNAISKTAYLAEAVSKTSMDSSAESAQIIAKEVLQEATVTQTWFTDMLKRTSADLDKLTQTRIDDTNNLIAANTTQRSMEGLLEVAAEEELAVARSYKISNEDLNLSLTATAQSINTATVQFEPMSAPFPFKGGSTSTAMNNSYYVCVAKEDTKSMYNSDVVQTSFNAYGPSDDEPREVRFVKVNHTIVNTLQLGADTTNSTDKTATTQTPKLLKDLDGDDIKPGVKYVVFIYTVLDQDYKREVNNYNDALSAASQSFTMTTLLQTVKAVDSGCLTCQLDDDGQLGNLTVQFKVEPEIESSIAEYRVILVPNESLCHSDAKDQGKCEQSSTMPMNIWFDKDIALQVAEVNYQVASASNCNDEGEVTNPQIMAATFNALDSDNFGQLLIPGKAYVYWVLAVVTELQTDNVDAYTPALTQLSSGVLGQDGSDDGDSGNGEEGTIAEDIEKIKQQAQQYKEQLTKVAQDKTTLEKDKETLSNDKAQLVEEVEDLKKKLEAKAKTSTTQDKTPAGDSKTTASNTTAKPATTKRNGRN